MRCTASFTGFNRFHGLQFCGQDFVCDEKNQPSPRSKGGGQPPEKSLVCRVQNLLKDKGRKSDMWRFPFHNSNHFRPLSSNIKKKKLFYQVNQIFKNSSNSSNFPSKMAKTVDVWHLQRNPTNHIQWPTKFRGAVDFWASFLLLSLSEPGGWSDVGRYAYAYLDR